MKREEISLLAGLRGHLYRLLAGLYLRPPERETISLLLSPGLLETLCRLLGPELLGGLQRFQGEFEGDLSELQQEYMNLLVVPLGQYVAPYESVYREGFLMGRSATAARSDYQRAGFELSPHYRDLPDHVGLELELMGHLCEGERRGWERQDECQALDYLRQEGEFLGQHLVGWVPQLCQAILDKSSALFYQGIAQLTRGFILAEGETFRDLCPPFQRDRLLHR